MTAVHKKGLFGNFRNFPDIWESSQITQISQAVGKFPKFPWNFPRCLVIWEISNIFLKRTPSDFLRTLGNLGKFPNYHGKLLLARHLGKFQKLPNCPSQLEKFPNYHGTFPDCWTSGKDPKLLWNFPRGLVIWEISNIVYRDSPQISIGI